MGKRLENAKKEVDPTKKYPLQEALTLAKKTATTKFVGNLEVHVRLGIDPKKTDQSIRGTVKLPHGSGKIKRIAAFVTEAKEKEATEAGAVLVGGEDLIKKIKETEQLNFDVAIAEPAMMAKMASIAKILGPRGLMPNPKTGTVTPEIGKAVKEYASGKMEFKNDESGNVHMLLGKSNFSEEQLSSNFSAFMESLQATKPSTIKKEFISSISINATMGPGIKLQL
ncbi:MAG: 50S ribosomal protein L1 [Candidatus Doudnabacteria bacterium]|nr:50S ribosomal protein L1 [Candidatus Doudnabacteria bacterium]